jgi:aryl-alcohol dehydrogenase-like predicted oxidoreductase
VLRALEAGLLTDRPPSFVAARDGEPGAPQRISLAALLAPEPLAETALRFALSRPDVATVLVGFSDVSQVESAVASAAKGALEKPLLSRIEAWRSGAS